MTDPLSVEPHELFVGVPSPVWSEWNDDQLQVLTLAVFMACSRVGVPVVKKKRNEWFCSLGRVLTAELDNRGLPHPAPPFHASAIAGTPPSL